MTAGSVTGTLKTTSGLPIVNATVTIQDTGVATTTTNSFGQYTFWGLNSVPHTVTASYPGCTFSPSSASNVWPGTMVNFTGSGTCSGSGSGSQTFNGTIQGTLMSTTGKPIPGAHVTIQGTGTFNATTDVNGHYAFTGLSSTGHTITASLTNCSFSPGVANNVWPGATQNFSGSGTGCSGSAGSGTGTTTAPCPSPDANDGPARAAATAAYSIMVGAAQMGGPVAPVFSNTILASQRYRIQASGTGIEFDPGDPLYHYVSSSMQAALAFAQLDPTVAKYLSDGLNAAYASSNGLYFPSIGAVSVLANFHYPASATVHVADNTSQNNSHQATASGQPWCGSQMITILDTVQESYSFSPLYAAQITNPGISIGGGWLYSPPAAFHGSSSLPTTPFNGPSASGNPYLVVAVNGTAANWSTYNFTPQNCWNNPAPNECTGTIQIDPVPYAEPGAYYDTSGNLVGTQSNPFFIAGTLYATPDHVSQWATRTVNGVQEWGTFSTPVSLLGITLYKYVKKM